MSNFTQWLMQHGMSFLLVTTVTWWIIWYMVLPIGVPLRSKKAPVPGQAKSAPPHPFLGRKWLLTTVLTLILSYPLFWACEHWVFVW